MLGMMDDVTADSSAPDPAASAPKPLRRDAERNRQLILRAASELFAQRGLAVSLDDVAAHAGVGVGTVYRRFPSRDAIVDELFRERVGELVANGERALEIAQDDPWQGIVQLLSGYLEIQAGDRAFGPVVLTNAHGRGELDAARLRLKPIVDELVDRAQAAGVLREDFVTTDMPALILMLATLQNAARDVSPDAWRRQLAIVLDGLRPTREATTAMTGPPLDALEIPKLMHDAFAQPRR